MKAKIVKNVSAPRISGRGSFWVPREPLTHWSHSGPSGPTIYISVVSKLGEHSAVDVLRSSTLITISVSFSFSLAPFLSLSLSPLFALVHSSSPSFHLFFSLSLTPCRNLSIPSPVSSPLVPAGLSM